jgi:hypothetical protein
MEAVIPNMIGTRKESSVKEIVGFRSYDLRAADTFLQRREQLWQADRLVGRRTLEQGLWKRSKNIMRIVKPTMKTKALFFAALLVASTSISSADPVISASSEDSVTISSASVVRASGGGSYVTGMVEPSFGYAAPLGAQVSVAAYGESGKLLAEKVDAINSDDLVTSHFNPSPRAPYAVFLPLEPSQIAKVSVVEYSGHSHPG